MINSVNTIHGEKDFKVSTALKNLYKSVIIKFLCTRNTALNAVKLPSERCGGSGGRQSDLVAICLRACL